MLNNKFNIYLICDLMLKYLIISLKWEYWDNLYGNLSLLQNTQQAISLERVIKKKQLKILSVSAPK